MTCGGVIIDHVIDMT